MERTPEDTPFYRVCVAPSAGRVVSYFFRVRRCAQVRIHG
jgi:hypothetical protein